MKKWIALFLCLIMTFACSLALADGDCDITVTATGSVSLDPDTAQLYLGVSTNAATVTEAQTQNAQLMQKVMDALKALGIEDKDLSTSSYTVNPVYNYSAETPTLEGYSVENTLFVVVRTLDNVSAVIDGAMAAGANNVYGLSFVSSQSAAAYDQALALAIAEGRRKAELMATAAGLTLDTVSSISEQGSSYAPIQRANLAAGSMADATPIQAGSLTVTATVTVGFETK